jgi:hypothetical protein
MKTQHIRHRKKRFLWRRATDILGHFADKQRYSFVTEQGRMSRRKLPVLLQNQQLLKEGPSFSKSKNLVQLFLTHGEK